MSIINDQFNNLPIEVRKIAGNSILQRQILDYRIELDRAKRAHRKHLKDIREHLKSCEDAMDRIVIGLEAKAVAEGE